MKTTKFSPRIAMAILLIILSGCSIHNDSEAEQLGHEYSRKDGFILYQGKRIDEEIPHDLDFLKGFLRRKLITPQNVDATSFKVLSKQYSKDKNTVYYRWIRGTKFWFVEITGADVDTFEYLTSNLARDKNHVWNRDHIIAGADTAAIEVMGWPGRVWKDNKHVWFVENVVKDADPATFEALGDGYHYRDAKRVYWIFNVVKVLENADPETFTPPGLKKQASLSAPIQMPLQTPSPASKDHPPIQGENLRTLYIMDERFFISNMGVA